MTKYIIFIQENEGNFYRVFEGIGVESGTTKCINQFADILSINELFI